MNHDPANPKDLIGSTKAPLSLVPVTAIKEAALALFLGKTKYGRVNWRATKVYAHIYFEAMLRHAYRWWEGNDYDPEDGTPELGNAIACLCILIDAKVCGTLIDNRQFKGEAAARYISEGLGVMQTIEQKYADKKPHHYTMQDMVQGSKEIVSYAVNGGNAKDPAVIVLASGQVLPGQDIPFSGGKAP
jgi:hypothetical protein